MIKGYEIPIKDMYNTYVYLARTHDTSHGGLSVNRLRLSLTNSN